MKKVIEGRMYNTDTAKCIAEIDNYPDFYYCDYGYECERLYLKKTGEYFATYTGNKFNPCEQEFEYREAGEEHNGGPTAFSVYIAPLCEHEAKRWAEKLSAEEYEEIFGEVEE